MPILGFSTLHQVVSASLALRRASLSLVGNFAVLSVILALIGIYGVLSHAVTQRTQEMGLRLAVGATPIEIIRLVLGEGARLALEKMKSLSGRKYKLVQPISARSTPCRCTPEVERDQRCSSLHLPYRKHICVELSPAEWYVRHERSYRPDSIRSHLYYSERHINEVATNIVGEIASCD